MAKREIVHIEIPAKDRESLAKFYGAMFGWKITNLPQIQYAMFDSGSVTGGFPSIDRKIYKGDDVVIYVSSEDIDADLKRAIELGATKVLGKSEIAGWGQYAIFREPAGSRIALWKSAK